MGEISFFLYFQRNIIPTKEKLLRSEWNVLIAIVKIKICLKYEKWERVQGIMTFLWCYNWDRVWWMTDFWFDVAFTTVAVCLPLGAGGTEWIKSSEVDKN